ncbi:MAG: hypothetical protein EBY28_22675 [Betaproteobacteria bacterium]|nr:hypothetical protein [Betaproteobacteria bacterium]
MAGSAIESWIKRMAASPLVVIGASGGAMQFTPNVSLFRLVSCSLQEVLAQRSGHRALDLVPFEILPHFDRQPAELLEKARRYSGQVDHAIWCLADGAAVATTSGGTSVRIGSASCLYGGDFS